MNSFQGDLYFTAGIDDSQFNISAEAMERRMQQMSSTVQAEASDMEQSIQDFAKRGAEYITTFLVGKGMYDLVKSIVEVRGEFQQLEIAFETMLGSADKANALMSQLTETAAKTPFDLKGVANGAKQLLAYGTAAEDVNDTLVRLGDIASGLSIPLNDMVMLYGTTMTQGRMFTQDLRQFMGRGIPLAEELAKQFGVTTDKVGELVTAGKVTSKEFNAAIMAMSSEGGKFYNLMERQSASLTGQISNLSDAWDVARNNIGKSMEGIAGDAISMTTSIVENLEPILRTVRAVAIAYGSYRAALVLNTLATKGETGVALIDNTVKKAKVQMLRLEEKATSGAAERIKELKRARQEEIEALERQLSAEERLNLVHQARIASIGQVLTETQKLELRNLGLTESSEDYEKIALSMMSNEQRLSVERAELTKNTGEYISRLNEAVGAKTSNVKAIDDEIAKTQEELKFAVEYRNVVQEQVSASRDRCKALENEITNLDLFGDAEGAAAKATEWKAEKTRLATLEEELSTAATAANEKQTNLETLAKRRNAAATVGGAAADKAGAVAKTLFARASQRAAIAVRTLWAAMKANPLGWVLTAFGAVIAAVDLFRSKSKEAEIAVEDYNSAIRAEKNELRTLMDILDGADENTAIYRDTVDKLKRLAEQYHVTILDENGALREQKEIYEELSAAIRETTGEKIRAKYIEKYNKEKDTALESELESLIKSGGRASYWQITTDAANNRTAYRRRAKSIRNMDESEWVTAFEQMADTAERMQELNATESQELYNRTLNQILQYIQRVSGATDEEMGGIRDTVVETFGNVINAAEEADRKVSHLGDIGFSKGIKEQADIAKMSVKELEDKIADVTSQLEILAKQSGSGILLPGMLPTQGNAPTRAPFLDAASQQQYEKEEEKRLLQEELNRRKAETKKKELSDEEKREAEKREKARQEAARKLLDMQLESQRAEIEAMEDGYQKRMAQLEFERKQELAKIDRDAEELKAARKKAGKKAELTPEEEANQQTRRDATNEKYGRSRLQAAEDEINTMREKYREYERWVEMVGQDAADKHFRGLREAGDSFSDWVQRQIAELEARKNQSPTDFTDSDEKALGAFGDASKGADELDYYDKLRRGIEGSIAGATNLTAKIKELNAAIDKIKKDPKLTSEQKAALGLEYAEQLINAEDENQRRFNEAYQMYSKTRRETVEQYQADIKKLTDSGDTFQAEQVKAEMKRSMADLDEDFLKSLFGEVFSGKATTKAIRAAVKDLGKIKGMDLVTFNSTYNTDFTNEELEELKGNIDKVNSSLRDMGGYSIADAFKDIRDGRIAGDLEKVARGTQHIQNVFSNFTNVVNTLSSALNDLAEASDNENLKNTAKTVSQVSNVLSTAGQWAGMGSSIGGGWGALIGGILGGGLGVITEIFKSNQEKEEEHQRRVEDSINRIHDSVSELNAIIDSIDSIRETVSSLNYNAFRSSMLDMMNAMTTNEYKVGESAHSYRDAMNANGWNITPANNGLWGALYTNNPAALPNNLQALYFAALARLREQLYNALGGTGDFMTGTDIPNISSEVFNEIVERTLRAIGESMSNSDFSRDNPDYSIANGLGWGIAEYIKEQLNKLQQLKSQLTEYYYDNPYDSLGLFNLTNQSYQTNKNILEAEYLQALLAGDIELANDLLAEIQEIEYNQMTALQNMAEGLYGTDMLSLVEEWISIIEEFGDNVDGAFDKMDEGIDRMIANMLKQRLVVEPMLDYFDQIFKRYSNINEDIDEDILQSIAREIGEGKEEFRRRYNAYLEALRQADISFDNLIGDPTTVTGSVQNISEETGGVIAGKMNAVVINQAEGVSVMRQQLLVQYEMRNSLVAIQADVAAIRQRFGNTATPNPYLHQGIV